MAQLLLADRAVLVAVEVFEQGVVAVDRQSADLHAEGAQRGPEDLRQLLEGDLAVLRAGVEVGAGERRRAAGRRPDHRGERAAIGLLLGQGAVSIAVEVRMDGLHRIEPGRPERLAARIQLQPDEDGPVLAEEHHILDGIPAGVGSLGLGPRIVVRGRRGREPERRRRGQDEQAVVHFHASTS
jgi:hypothetical protein